MSDWPLSFSMEPLQIMLDPVVYSFPAQEAIKDKNTQNLWTPIGQQGVGSVHKLGVDAWRKDTRSTKIGCRITWRVTVIWFVVQNKKRG